MIIQSLPSDLVSQGAIINQHLPEYQQRVHPRSQPQRAVSPGLAAAKGATVAQRDFMEEGDRKVEQMRMERERELREMKRAREQELLQVSFDAGAGALILYCPRMRMM